MKIIHNDSHNLDLISKLHAVPNANSVIHKDDADRIGQM